MKKLYIKYYTVILLLAAFFVSAPAGAQQEKMFFAQALKNFKECNYKSASEDFTKAISFDDKTGESFAYRARCAIFLGDFGSAEADLQQASALLKDNAQLYLSYGYYYNEKKDYKKAIDVLDKALKKDFKLAEAYNARGFARQSLGDIKGALIDFTQAIKFDNKYALAYNNHGSAIFFNQDIAKAGKWDFKNAMYDFAKAVELDSTLCVARRNKALVHRLKLENSEAMNEINAAIRCDPENADFYMTRGVIMTELKSPDQAIANFETALSKNPNYGMAYVEMGRAKARLKRYDEAYSDLDRALEVQPDLKGEVFYARATVAAHKGHKDDMIHFLNKAKQAGFFNTKTAVANFKEDPDFMMMRSKPDYIKFVNKIR